MFQNNTVKNRNDTEKSYDTIINSSEFISNARNKLNMKSNLLTKKKALEFDAFDISIDKRK